MERIYSIPEIIEFLRNQADQRAQENDDAGVLRDAADYIYSECDILANLNKTVRSAAHPEQTDG
jgi:hypothetical protein